MTDHSSSADGAGEGRPSGQPSQPNPQSPGPYAHPGTAAPQLSPEEARTQVAAAWVRVAPQSNVPPGQAAVPSLPPRTEQPVAESKKDKRKAEYERKKAQRKADYEAKKAAREERKRGGKGGTVPAAASAPAALVSPAPSSSAAPVSVTKGEDRAVPADPAPGGANGTRAVFDVPRPGGRLPSQGRGLHAALRATLLITTCGLALGSCAVTGLVIGRSSVSLKPASLDGQELDRYRLSEFPTQTAAVFAEEYATLCMTYSPETADKRRESLARFASAGVDRECGWNGKGKQEVKLASWDGTTEELPEYGKNGRYLNIQLTYGNGRTTTLSVPVYVKDLGKGSGLRIAGDVGEMPLPVRDTVPVVDKKDEVVDQTLSGQLKEQVLPGYFKAWAASDTTALTRFTTPDATASAVTGLAGVLTDPVVQEVQALAPEGAKVGDKLTYAQGQSVPARVTVIWGGGGPDDGKNAVTLKRSYRVTVVNTPQGWFIKDVRGGVMDPTGGRADEGKTAAPAVSPSATPAAGAGNPSSPAGPSSPGPSSSPKAASSKPAH
ncbi:conjugal transfer protein [Streptomyces sp. NPDC001373]|uniref:conjugal transfer protein n=1 Tax=Streptomyces sp. NPDC001373 TaxID=3364565 RepID=UPI0036CB3655